MEESHDYMKLHDEAAERALRSAVPTANLFAQRSSAHFSGGLKRVDATFGFGSGAETVTFSLLVGRDKGNDRIIEDACRLASMLEGARWAGTFEVFLICLTVEGRPVFLLED